MTERTFWRRLHARWAARRPPVVSVLRLDGVIGGGGRFQRGLNLDGLADEIVADWKQKQDVKHLKEIDV